MGNFKEKVCISIFCLTYNHAPYIRDAIEGFLMQETEYPFNIFIFDDASDDGTSKIITEYQEKYPEKIDIYIAKQNTYGKKIRKELLDRLMREYLSGKYIALCEGDDYWVSPEKLQKQVKFMEKHPDCSMTVHAAQLVDCRTGVTYRYTRFNRSEYLSAADIIVNAGTGLPTASYVLRKDAYFWPDDFPKCGVVGDWPRQLYALTKGKIYYINETMSVYRYMHNHSWSSQCADDRLFYMQQTLGMIKFSKAYDMYTEKRFHLDIRMRISELFYANLYENGLDLTVSSLDKKCALLSNRTNGEYDCLLEDMKRLKRLLHGEAYVDEQLNRYIEDKEYLVIMGTGEYSWIMTEHFRSMGIEISGHIVSDDQDIQKTDSRIIWKFKDYPYQWDKTGMIIALHPCWQTEIENVLCQEEITDYYAPFWVEDRVNYGKGGFV